MLFDNFEDLDDGSQDTLTDSNFIFALVRRKLPEVDDTSVSITWNQFH